MTNINEYKNNHYVPVFFQKPWAIKGKSMARSWAFKDGRIIKPKASGTSIRSIASENWAHLLDDNLNLEESLYKEVDNRGAFLVSKIRSNPNSLIEMSRDELDSLFELISSIKSRCPSNIMRHEMASLDPDTDFGSFLNSQDPDFKEDYLSRSENGKNTKGGALYAAIGVNLGRYLHGLYITIRTVSSESLVLSDNPAQSLLEAHVSLIPFSPNQALIISKSIQGLLHYSYMHEKNFVKLSNLSTMKFCSVVHEPNRCVSSFIEKYIGWGLRLSEQESDLFIKSVEEESNKAPYVHDEFSIIGPDSQQTISNRILEFELINKERFSRSSQRNIIRKLNVSSMSFK